MPEPKYVIAMGACTCGGGMFTDSYSVVNGIDKIIPVDIYLPMCPPKPEALLDSLIKLQKKIRKETILDRQKYIAEHVSALKIDEDEEILVEDSGIIVQQGGLSGDLSEELTEEFKGDLDFEF
jgi:NADH:ubiquinone oxidoreductase subunit B-like Fe-S oxidoreductase